MGIVGSVSVVALLLVLSINALIQKTLWSVVLQCSSVRKNQDNLGILQKDHSQNVMYRTLLSYYSRTSHNGPSEKLTEHYDRLEIPTLMLILAILSGVAPSCESNYTKLVIIYSMNRANGMS